MLYRCRNCDEVTDGHGPSGLTSRGGMCPTCADDPDATIRNPGSGESQDEMRPEWVAKLQQGRA